MGPEDAGARLDKLVLARIPGDAPARSLIQSWIKGRMIWINGQPCTKPSFCPPSMSLVRVRAALPQSGPVPMSGKIHEIYRDDHILVLNKQPGLSVHPAPSVELPTLVNFLISRDLFSGHFPDPDRPGIVHRLDKDTSGLMVVALNPDMAQKLSQAFQDREVEKKYLALVLGRPEKDQGEINQDLDRDPRSRVRMAVTRSGRPARTKYRVVHTGSDSKWSLVGLEILTGRTHQIRVHMAHLGHPVLGDSLYGREIHRTWDLKHRILAKLVKRQLLHSAKLGFKHPASGQWVSFAQALPKDFFRVFLYLEKKMQRVAITGAMGSGKSTVSRILRNLGYPVFCADSCVAGLYQPGQDGWTLIQRRFGDRFFDSSEGPVNKARLAEAIGQDKDILLEINHLIHPLVRHRLNKFWKEHRAKRVAFAEIPLLFESGLTKDCDLSVGVFCPDSIRGDRLEKKLGTGHGKAAVLDGHQLSQPEKIRRCALVVDNSAGPDDLEQRVRSLAIMLRYLRIKQVKKEAGLFQTRFDPDKVFHDTP